MDDVAARTQGRVAAHGIELAYETFGQARDPAIVLVMGWATQMIAWPDEVCAALAAGAISWPGSTTAMPASRPTSPRPAARRPLWPCSPGAGGGGALHGWTTWPTTTVAVLDALGWASAHVVGASMGGHDRADSWQFKHPQRVRTLTSIMSSTPAPAGRAGQA